MLLTYSRRVALGVVVLGTAALGAAGCSTATASPSDAYLSDLTQTELLASVQALNYPYESDPSFSTRIANLQTHLINECVAQQGVVPPKQVDLPLESAAIVPSQSRLWLLPNEDYGVAVALADPRIIAQLSDETTPGGGELEDVPDPDAYDKAVYGAENERIEMPIEGGGSASIPVGGCFGEATKTMYGVTDAADYERAYYEIPNIREVMTVLLADDDVRNATSAWSSCMGEAGHRAEAPPDLYEPMNTWVGGVINGTLKASDVQAQEAELARIDTGCRTSSGLGTTISEKFLDLAKDEIQGKEGVVQEYRTMIEHAQSLIAAS